MKICCQVAVFVIAFCSHAVAQERATNGFGRLEAAYPRTLDEAAPVTRLIKDQAYFVTARTKLAKALPLLFNAQVDRRPHVFESAVWWAAVNVDTTNQGWLVEFYRWPYGPLRAHQEWTISHTMGVHSPLAYRVFDRPPSNQEVEEFLKWAHFDLSPSRGFKFITTRVFTNNWITAIGIAPRVSFDEKIAAPDGAANGSQPLRSKTNRTSSAADDYPFPYLCPLAPR